jgi:predicted amidohydrolase
VDDLRVSLVQTDLIWHDPVANRQQIAKKIQSLVGITDLIVLPEMFTSGFTEEPNALTDTDHRQDQRTCQWLLQQAAVTNAAVCGSSVFSVADGFVNRLLMATPSGEIFHYDKVHLFRMGGDDERYQAGSIRQVISYRNWRFLLTVCYDLRFPVFCRNRSDYDVMLCVANWPASRRHHWRSLLIARAIENQTYVIGVNRVGVDGKGLAYSGDSMAIDCLGERLIDGEINHSWVQTATLKMQLLTEQRSKFPVWQDADSFRMQ